MTSITDLEVDYAIRDDLKLAVGANNLFDHHPPAIPLVPNGSGGVRPADRDHAEEVHVLVQEHDGTRGLDDLLRVGRQRLARMAVRQAQLGGIVMARIAGGPLEKLSLGAGLEWSHPAAIEISDARRVRIVGSDDVRERWSRPHSGEVRLAVGHAWNPGGLSRQYHRRRKEYRNKMSDHYFFSVGFTAWSWPISVSRPSENVTTLPDP